MRKMNKNFVLKGVTVIAVLTFLATTFYIDSDNWSMSDLFWQIPIMAACYGWMILFAVANNFGFPVRRKNQRKVRRAA